MQHALRGLTALGELLVWIVMLCRVQFLTHQCVRQTGRYIVQRRTWRLASRSTEWMKLSIDQPKAAYCLEFLSSYGN